jgi:predicted HD phosphohydrolase
LQHTPTIVNHADRTQPPAALLRDHWQHIHRGDLESLTHDEWTVLDAQRGEYYRAEQARQVLRMLAESAHDPSFGYTVNNFQHCLQSATLALRDGLPEEDVVVCLLHDIGFIAAPRQHGEFAAALLGPYVSDRNHWMLQRHAIFQDVHATHHPTLDRQARERWRGHPHFEWAARFVARYDQCAIDGGYDTAPLETFEPMVYRLFAKPPRAMPLPD